MEFEWDWRKAERNRRKHGVTFDEAVTIFFDPRELTIYDPDHSVAEERFLSIGMSSDGRLLVVGYTEHSARSCEREAARKTDVTESRRTKPLICLARHCPLVPPANHGIRVAGADPMPCLRPVLR